MSIRGIDSQMMITRAADLARDSSALLKRAELTQDYLAIQAKASEAQEQKRVGRKTEVEMQKLQADKDGSGSGAAGYSNANTKRKSRDPAQDPDTLVPPSNNVIDIRV